MLFRIPIWLCHFYLRDCARTRRMRCSILSVFLVLSVAAIAADATAVLIPAALARRLPISQALGWAGANLFP